MFKLRKNSYKFKLIRRNLSAILAFVLLFLNSLTSAQAVADKDSLVANIANTDTIATKDSFKISKEKLEYQVNYQSKDSIVYYAKKKHLFLHTEAEISYDDIKVTADSIWYQQDSTRLSAFERIGQLDDTSNKPRITQGQESSTFTSLHYNFNSRRALIENAYSQYGEGFILSQQVKRNNDNSISGYRNVYTTCNDPHPHFGISAKKIKIIPNKVAVTGSANLVIEDIPTPLYLPFGMFPLKQGQRSGFKLPTYDMSDQLGFGLRGGGYYFAINDHVDLQVASDIYALGSFRVGFNSNYIYRYRFNGSLDFNYTTTKIGEVYESNYRKFSNFNIRWVHAINPNVLPGSNFSANVNIVNNRNYQLYNTYDANTYLNNNFSSNIQYSKSWPGKPFNFTASLRHDQNTQTGIVNVTLPDVAFTVNQIFPFQFRKDIIKPRWYEKIGASYQFNGLNRITFNDSTFSLKALQFRDFDNGFKHSIPINASYHVLKYFNASLNLSYNEYWYTKKEFRQYNFYERVVDTNSSDGFYTARDFSTTASLSTRIYGIKLFKKGAIKGIRHVLTPSVNVRFQPDFGGGIGNYYYNTFTDSNFNSQRLSYFDGALLGGPPDGRFGGLGFNLGNTLQLKVRNRKDTINGTKKINLIDGFDIGGSFNLAVDSFKWSVVNFRYRTNLFENVNISGGLIYDPYALNRENGRRSPEFNYTETGRLLRFRSANLAIQASLPLRKNNGASAQMSATQKQTVGNDLSAYVDFNVPWNLRLNYNVGVDKNYILKRKKDTFEVRQTFNFDGDINLTEKWKIGMSSGIDFKTMEMTYTSFDIFRDLHCWAMHLNLIPFGPRKTYNFTLNVKSAVLQDLKLVRRRDFRDNL